MAKGHFTASDMKSQTKRCSACREIKPFSEFSPSTSNQGRPRIAALCRECFVIYQAAWRKKNPESGKRASARFHLKRACKSMGITVEQYYLTLERQGGVCKICGQPQRDKTRSRLALDHDHVTGEFRGLLCNPCNAGIAYFGDSILIMEEAIRYLRASKPLFQVIDGEAQ